MSSQSCGTCSTAHRICWTPEKSLSRGSRAAPCSRTCPSFSSRGWKLAPLNGASSAMETWTAKPSTISPTKLSLAQGERKVRNWWCWWKIGCLEPPAGRVGCWPGIHLPIQQLHKHPGAVMSKTRVTSPWKQAPEPIKWPKGDGNVAGHWSPAMSTGTSCMLVHTCLHATGSVLTLKHCLEEDSTYYTSLSCPSWKATWLLRSCSQFIPPAATGWCTHGNPGLEGISRNISSRIALLRHWKMFIKSLCNSHQWWRAHHLPGVGSQQELLFPAANPGWSWQHTGTLKHLVCEHQNGPWPPCDNMIWSVIGLWAWSTSFLDESLSSCCWQPWAQQRNLFFSFFWLFLAKWWLSCQRWITPHALSEHSLTIQSHKKQFLQGSFSVRLDFETRGLAWDLAGMFIKTLNKNRSPEHGNLVWFWAICQRALSTVGEGLGRKERQILPAAPSKAYSRCMKIFNDKKLLPQVFAWLLLLLQDLLDFHFSSFSSSSFSEISAARISSSSCAVEITRMVTNLSGDFDNISSPRWVSALWEVTGDLWCTGDFGGSGLKLEPCDQKKSPTP